MVKTLEEINAQRRKHYLEVKDKINAKIRADRLLNPEKYRNWARQKYLRNPEKIKQQIAESRIRCRPRMLKGLRKYNAEHKAQHKEYFAKYYAEHRNKIKKDTCRYKLEREKIDLNFKIGRRIGNRIRSGFRNQLKGNYRKDERTENLLGCTLSFLIKYLQLHFKEGMNLNNYGKWQIDHIIPISIHNLQNNEEKKKCFHYTNLQPLWKEDNLRKSNKLNFCQ